MEWRNLYHETSKGMKVFDKSDYAFKVRDNLKYCKRYTYKMEYDRNVRDWGAHIQAKVNLVYERGGGTVLLPEGDLWMTTHIEIPSYICLQGAGMYKTFLRVHASSPPYRLAGTIRTAFSERVSFFDFTQDGNRHNLPGSGQNRFGIYTHLSNYVWMKNLRIIDNKWFGFDPHGANTAWSYYLVMEDCFASGNGKDGYTIDQYYYVSMLNSVAIHNDRHGINVVSGSRYVLVKGNKIGKNTYCCLVAQNNEFGTGSVLFKNNECIDYPLAGVCLRGVFDVDVLDNRFYSEVYGRKKIPAFYMHNSWACRLVFNKVIKSKRMSVKANSPSNKEYGTVVIKNKKSERQKFRDAFKDIFKAPKKTVYLKSKKYGRRKVNNRVPLNYRGRKNRSVFEREIDHDKALENSKRGNNLRTSDAKCEKGIRMDTICCPKHCGTCKMKNCKHKGEDCCPKTIRQDAGSCDTFPAPCVMSRKHTTGPDEKCKFGVKKKKICCLKECGKCGGKGCGKRMKNNVCCKSTVKKMRRKCSRTSAPCIIDK